MSYKNLDSKAKHKLNSCYHNMIHRCTKLSNAEYPRYGGRGISVCQEWLASYHIFAQWALDNGWQPGLQIDRIDNNGNYEPSNVRFVDPKVNARNTSRTIYLDSKETLVDVAEQKGWDLQKYNSCVRKRYKRKGVTDNLFELENHNENVITYNEESLNQRQWSLRLGDNPHLVTTRIAQGYSPIEAITKPIRKVNKLYEYDNQKLTLEDWAKKTGIPLKTLRDRIQKNKWTIEKAVTYQKECSTYQGKTIQEWNKILGVNEEAIQCRLRRGMTLEEAITRPFRKSKNDPNYTPTTN